ncbi:MAG: hypothetical protein R6W86_00565 [Marinobacter sp.]|uniref:hypothetical protein n=1 Tax=Marinobacter sp. TaxID=50741 RepID=UPI00396D8483
MQVTRQGEVCLEVSGRAPINLQAGPAYEDRLFQAMMQSKVIAYKAMLEKVLGELPESIKAQNVTELEQALTDFDACSERITTVTLMHEIDGQNYTTHLVVNLDLSAEIKSVVLSKLAGFQ